MSFSSDLKEELSKISNLNKKDEVKYELIGYLISKNASVVKNNVRYATESEYNINRFSKLLKNLDIDNNIEFDGKSFIITFKVKNLIEEVEVVENQLEIKSNVDFEDIKKILSGQSEKLIQNEKDIKNNKLIIIENDNYKRAIIRGAFLAMGITIGAGGHALLTAGNEKVQENKTQTETTIDNTEKQQSTKNETKEKNFKEDIKAVTYSQITEEIAKEYNEKYNTNLSASDIAYIQSNPNFLAIDDNGTYIQDYKESENYNQYITSGINDVYVFINKNDDTIISSIGKVSNDIQNVDTKIVMGTGRKEYVESDKKIDITQGKNKEEKEKIYKAMQQKAQQKTQDNTKEKQVENEERE